MRPVVVDTNVILVANDRHDDARPECVAACARRLVRIMRHGILVVDEGYRIFREYQKKTNHDRGGGVGDAFVRWALDNSHNRSRVQLVHLTATPDGSFAEFPDPGLAAVFDPADRVFPAVAAAYPGGATICQAVDCKWLDWWAALARCGIRVEFLCRDDIRHFYARKFPGRTVPRLP